MVKNTLIDSHLDLAMNLVYYDRDIRLPLDQLNSAEQHMTDVAFRGRATLSLPELRSSRLAVCVATLIARSGPRHVRPGTYRRSEIDFGCSDGAQASAFAQLAYYRLLERVGEIRLIYSSKDLEDHWTQWHAGTTRRLGVILSIEGADPILHPDELWMWYEEGVRAIGLTHYGFGRYGAGTHVDGPLTALGHELLKRMEQIGIILDVTHLSDESMRNAFATYSGPIWASHHNCRSLVPGDRQLADAQIVELFQRQAVIGVAFDAIMLHPGWQLGKTQPSDAGLTLSSVADQIDRYCQLAGNCSQVGIGSDLDGGYGTEQTPIDLKRYSDMHRVVDLLSRRGYSQVDIEAICSGNWLRKLKDALPNSRSSHRTSERDDPAEARSVRSSATHLTKASSIVSR